MILRILVFQIAHHFGKSIIPGYPYLAPPKPQGFVRKKKSFFGTVLPSTRMVCNETSRSPSSWLYNISIYYFPTFNLPPSKPWICFKKIIIYIHKNIETIPGKIFRHPDATLRHKFIYKYIQKKPGTSLMTRQL